MLGCQRVAAGRAIRRDLARFPLLECLEEIDRPQMDILLLKYHGEIKFPHFLISNVCWRRSKATDATKLSADAAPSKLPIIASSPLRSAPLKPSTFKTVLTIISLPGDENHWAVGVLNQYGSSAWAVKWPLPRILGVK
jgi:hypothetical protein